MKNVVMETSFNDVTLVGKGKVRDIYDTKDAYLMVTTDRLSAFDVILPDAIPGKGSVLNLISIFWYEKMKDIVDNHLITADVNEYPEPLRKYGDILENRSMLVKKAKPLPVECIVRGYISGSGWNSYRKEGHVCGIDLPDGLRESDRLLEPLYTPSTKAEAGLHDENISYEKTVELMGAETAEKVKKLSLDIYKRGAEIALEKGIIIADTKFEFGIVDDRIVLIDEVLTPDSSRFWPKKEYEPGKSQRSYDKQYVRDWLMQSGWDKTPPGPNLPEEVIRNTADTYKEIFDLLTDGGK
ncbi:MAG: phosphoribosylaminoimidazolesuccinocarboxamide synthase [Desulfarculaceae bacterium]|nr:phosphoribosylaminoimidazolesuccinocarboxamide synthase [Desulfarculaceae bacterium]